MRRFLSLSVSGGFDGGGVGEGSVEIKNFLRFVNVILRAGCWTRGVSRNRGGEGKSKCWLGDGEEEAKHT